MSNAIVGMEDQLLPHLQLAILKADRIRFNIAFLMESGAKLIAPALAEAAGHGAHVQILTGRYMSITEPSAIYFLLDKLENRIDIRFFTDNLRSFHPKAYLFDYGSEAEVFVGSSNLSLSALTSGLEWNYRMLRSTHPEDYQKFSKTFDELFHRHAEPVSPEVLRRYALNWKKPASVRTEQEIENLLIDVSVPAPRGAQIEALYELKRARMEGVEKGLVVAATGVGKTYLAAFDSARYRRVLFLAHREEILKQAETSFKTVRPSARIGFFTGSIKNEGAEIYFAMVQTLAREGNLASFEPDFFDYLVVDEFHHAAADSYRMVLNYFRPRFLLGLTATPYRTDNRDIYVLCDDNVVYELYLKDAINRDLLVPFRYYGFYDPTDYSRIGYHNGKYIIEEVEKQLAREGRAALVLDKYRQIASQHTLAFCVSIKHAEFMAGYFNQNGIPSAAVHSGQNGNRHVMDRSRTLDALIQGKLKVIFAVDIFNEGVDIPCLDTVMFLRPTESLVVFLQQPGRGLRKYAGKTCLSILDFIGNYKRAHYIPALLAGENPMVARGSRKRPMEYNFPEQCQVQFEFQVLDLFAEMARSDPLPIRMREDFYRLKELLGSRPTRVDILSSSDIPAREFMREGWLRFLESVGDLDGREAGWLGTPAEDFLKELERTSMSRAYKLPTIGALLKGQQIKERVPLAEVGQSMMSFYVNHPLHQKDLRDQSNQGWQSWGLQQFMNLAKRNPVHFLSRGRFFNYDEVNKVFYLSEELVPFLCSALAGHVRDILEYRRLGYFRRRFAEDEQ